MKLSYLLPTMIAALSLAACNQRQASPTAQNNADESANAVTAEGNAAASTAAAASVAFRGCPIRSDIDSGCLTVKSDNGVTYELYSSKALPDPSKHLVVEGTGQPGGVSTCMVGTPLNNVEWHYMKMSCGGKEEPAADKKEH